MTKVKLYPHEEICPEGIELEISPGEYLCEKLLDNGIPVEQDRKSTRLNSSHW